MKIKRILPIFLLSLFLCACGEVEEPVDPEPEFEFDNTGESSALGIDIHDRNLLSLLTNNTFYIRHNDTLYPVYLDETSYEVKDEDFDIESARPSPKRMLFYYLDNEQNIPTLYKGDSLIYYSTDTLLDTMTFERYRDLGYTVGLYNLQKLTSDRYYIALDDDDNYPILNNSSLSELSTIGVDDILIDKIATVPITSEFVEDGIIKHLSKGTEYDIEVYNGSQFKHYNTKVDYHAFVSFEVFGTIEYETLQDYIYEIKIPDYLVTGYYDINNVGLFRYIKDDTIYNDDTDFNVPLLYLSEAQIKNNESTRLYSEVPELNNFVSEVPGTLGYVDPDAPPELALNEEITYDENGEQNIQIKKSVIKEFELWLPKGISGKVEINSKYGEKTGDITIETSKTSKTANYDPITENYVLEINGRGEKATLKVGGFYKSYDIILTNIEEYNNQDLLPETPEESAPEEEPKEKFKITNIFSKE